MDEHHPYALLYQPSPDAKCEPAITIAMLARIKGWTTKRTQTAVSRTSIEPFPEPLDGRTPAYPRDKLLKAIEARRAAGRPRKKT